MNVCTLHWNNGLCHSTRLWSPNRSSTKLVWHCKDTQTPFWTWERSSQIQLGDHLQNQVLCKACSTRLRLSTESVMLCQAKICAWRVNKFQQIISSFFAPWTCFKRHSPNSKCSSSSRFKQNDYKGDCVVLAPYIRNEQECRSDNLGQSERTTTCSRR